MKRLRGHIATVGMDRRLLRRGFLRTKEFGLESFLFVALENAAVN
jgi:hypothetical protein